VKVADGAYLYLGQLPPGRFTAHLREWEYVSVRFVTAVSVPPNVAGVTLRTAPPSGGPEFETSLLSGDATERWGNLISGREIWRGTDVPDSWPVSLSWDSEGLGERALDDLTLSSSLAGALSDCLASDPNRAVLDAGPFGRVSWRRPPDIAPAGEGIRQLP